MPTAAGSRAWMSFQSMAGSARPGSPRGNAPTTATPRPSSRSASEAAIAATTTTSAGGIFGASRRKQDDHRQQAQAEDQGRCHAARRSLPASSARRGKKSLCSSRMPNSLSSCEATRIKAAPVM